MAILNQLTDVNIRILIGFIIYSLTYFKLGVKKSSGVKFSGLITTGIYKYLRHPQILGWLIILLGITFYLNSLTSLILTFVLWILFKILQQPLEERQLLQEYGEKYLQYKRKTLSGI